MTSNVKAVFDEAIKDFDKGLYNRAISKFREVIKLDDTYVLSEVARKFISEAHQKSALKYISKEMYKKALEEIDESESDGISQPLNEFLRGVIYNNLDDFSKSLKIFRSLLEKNERDIGGLSICYSIVLLNIGFLDEALKILQKSKEMPPYASRLNYLKAVVSFRLGFLDNVENFLKNSMKLRSPNLEAEKALIAYKLFIKEYENAILLIEKIFEFLRDEDKRYFLPPLLFLKKYLQMKFDGSEIERFIRENEGNITVTEKTLNKWIDKEFYKTLKISIDFLPDLIPPQDSIRNSWFRSSLINFYKGLLEKGVKNFIIYFNLGREYQRLRNRKEAVYYLEKSLEMNPDFVPAKISLAFAYKHSENIQKAIDIFEDIIDDLESGLEINFKSSKFLTELPGYTDNKGILQKELNIYLMAVKTNPDFADLYFNIGKIYYYLEDPVKAYDYFEKAYILNPEFTRAKIGMAFSLMQLNKVAEARDILEELKSEKKLMEKVAYNLFLLYKKVGDQEKVSKYESILKNTSFNNLLS